MKSNSSIAIMAICTLTASLVGTVTKATAGEYDFYINAHNDATHGWAAPVDTVPLQIHQTQSNTETGSHQTEPQWIEPESATRSVPECKPGPNRERRVNTAMYQ